MGKIVVCGGANFDIHSRVLHEMVMRDSNIAHLFTSSGGVGRNIAETLSGLGNDVTLLSSVGDDAFGRSIISDCKKTGIDCSRIYTDKDHPTSVYLDILDKDGDMFLATNDMRIIDAIPEEYFKANEDAFKEADAIVLDGNLNEEQLREIAGIAEEYGIRIYADSVSTLKCNRLKSIMDKIYCIKPNRMELEKLTGIEAGNLFDIEDGCYALLDMGVKEVLVSLGSEGCFFADRKGNIIKKDAEKVECVASATGAGDSFFAGYIDASVRALSPDECLSFAITQGALAVGNSNNSSIV